MRRHRALVLETFSSMYADFSSYKYTYHLWPDTYGSNKSADRVA